MIVLIDVSRKGEVMHRLRGHEDEIHSLAWSPQANEDGLYGRPEDSEGSGELQSSSLSLCVNDAHSRFVVLPVATNGGSAGEGRGCYLASGSKDQTVKIWSTAKGRGERFGRSSSSIPATLPLNHQSSSPRAGVTTMKLPYLKKRGSAVDPGVKERLWLNVHWPKGRPTQLVSSCFRYKHTSVLSERRRTNTVVFSR